MEFPYIFDLYEKIVLMKLFLSTGLFFFSASNSFSQSDTSGNLTVRGGNCHYYIDGIKVREHAVCTKTSLEDIEVITGGIPVIYGDSKGNMIPAGTTPTLVTPRKTADKKQNMATE